jgi:D-alanyl-D-alanine carboxypeptidase (penicillin-binding protein 5/6)
MRAMRRLAILLIVAMLCPVLAQAAKHPARHAAKKPAKQVAKAPAKSSLDPFARSARAYLVQVGGTTVWTHQPDQKLPPASITKIMTALLTLERANLNEVVTVPQSVKDETGSRMHLRPGDRMRVRDLLAAMLIESANDAAHVLAVHVGGSEARFAALMNARAVQLGMKNTHFTNSAGHHDPAHYTTANDLVRLTESALARPMFRELVSKVRYEVSTVDGKRNFKLVNSNKLLPKYEGMVGVKTGYTPEAGRCLVALAERNGVEVLIVLLRAKDRWNLATRMLDSAFQRYAYLGNGKQPLAVATR